MQVYAISTGSFRMGMGIMSIFSLGTLPSLMGIGSLTSLFKGKIAKIAYQVIGVLVILLGIYNISNAYGVIKATLFSSTDQTCPTGDASDSSCKIGEVNASLPAMETLSMTYTKN
jgi:sulfite exporter TauE/SafE